MATEEITIRTDDGDCPAVVFTPEQGSGPWPGAITYMDALGMRPVLWTMSERLAAAGYVVLLPDLFYRLGDYDKLDPTAVFSSDNPRELFGPMLESTDGKRAVADTAHFLAYLDGRDDTDASRVGTTGYCMGGGLSLHVAAAFPDRVKAAASFHGGNLVTDAELSVHRVVDKIEGRVYIGAADNDGSYPPDMAAKFVETLMEHHVDFRHDLYVGAAHGWCMADFPVYDEAAAERHWTELTRLFDEALH